MKTIQNLDYEEAWRAVRDLVPEEEREFAAVEFAVRCGELNAINYLGQQDEQEEAIFYVLDDGVKWFNNGKEPIAEVRLINHLFEVKIY